MMKSYDPNIKWHPQTVAITLMQWDYSETYSVVVNGNCTGFTVMDSAIEVLLEQLPIPHGCSYCVLTNKAGKTLECVDDEQRGMDWLSKMVVSVQIIAVDEVAIV